LNELSGVNNALQKTYTAVLALNDYGRAKANGNFAGGLSTYLKHTSLGYRGWYANRHAEFESADVGNQDRYRRPRTFRVDDLDRDIYMEAHLKITQEDMRSPRLHYYDATAETGYVYIGYLGPHLPSKRTNQLATETMESLLDQANRGFRDLYDARNASSWPRSGTDARTGVNCHRFMRQSRIPAASTALLTRQCVSRQREIVSNGLFEAETTLKKLIVYTGFRIMTKPPPARNAVAKSPPNAGAFPTGRPDRRVCHLGGYDRASVRNRYPIDN